MVYELYLSKVVISFFKKPTGVKLTRSNGKKKKKAFSIPRCRELLKAEREAVLVRKGEKTLKM